MGARLAKLRPKLRRRKRRKDKTSSGMDNEGFAAHALRNVSQALAATLARCVQTPNGISHDALMAVQSWASLAGNEAVLCSLDTFAILDLEGEALASTPDWNLSKSQAQGIIYAVSSSYHSAMQLTVSSTVYTCFHADQSMTVIGRDNDHVLVVHRGDVCCVIGLKNINSSGSCLHDVSELLDYAQKRCPS